MAVNKVVFGNDTLIDLTEDTVQPEDVALGETFHDRSGALRTGTSSGAGGVPIELLEDTVGWTGKNMFQYPSNIENPFTHKGVTFSYNREAGTIAANGTNDKTANSNFGAKAADVFTFDSAEPVIVSCETGSVGYAVLHDRTADTPVISNLVTGMEKTIIPIIGHSYNFLMRIPTNTPQVTDLVFKPMIRKASIADSTFEPYHEDVDTCKANNSALAPVIDQDTAPRDIARGKPFMHYGDFCIAKTAIASGATLTENSNYTVGTVGDSMQNIITSATLGESASTYGITLDSASSNNRVVRYGNVVNFKVGIVVASDVTINANVYPVILGYEPVIDNPRIEVLKRESPYEPLSGHARVGTGGGINLRYVPLQAGTYDLQGTYICQ